MFLQMQKRQKPNKQPAQVAIKGKNAQKQLVPIRQAAVNKL